MLLLKLWGLAEVREAGSWLGELLTALGGEVSGCQSRHSHSFTWAVGAGAGGRQVWGVQSAPQDSWSTSDSHMDWLVCPASGRSGQHLPWAGEHPSPFSLCVPLDAMARDSQQGHMFLSTQVASPAPPAHPAPRTNSPSSLTLMTCGTLLFSPTNSF